MSHKAALSPDITQISESANSISLFLAPSGIKASDYERTDRPTTAPPPGTPSWCPPPQKIGRPPLDTDTVDTECINY